MIQGNCPKCGAPLYNVPENVEYANCKYCNSRVQVRDVSEIAKDTEDKLPEYPPSPPLPPPLPPPPAQTTQKSTVFYWVVFFLMPPLWAILVIRDKAMDQYLKVIAWLVLGGTVFSCFVTLVPACIASLGLD